MSFAVVTADRLDWITRPHEPGEPARHVAEFSELADLGHTRANVWRFEPGNVGRRHVEPDQEETFYVVSGTLSIYLGEPPVRYDVRAGGLVHVKPGTPLQSANHGDEELVVFVYGAPPGMGRSTILDSAVA